MSIRLMTLAWELRISATPKIVLLALCDWANDEGHCYPSVARIALRASISARQCKRVLHHLVDEEWVSVVANQTGGASSRRYLINVHALQTGDTGVTGANTSPVTPVSSGGVSYRAQTSDTHVTRTTIQPSLEPPLTNTVSDSLMFPHQLSTEERVVVVDLIEGMNPELGQALLDELAGQLAAGKIKTTASNFMRALVDRARTGRFTPAYGPGVASKRARDTAERESVATTPKKPIPPDLSKTRDQIAQVVALLHS